MKSYVLITHEFQTNTELTHEFNTENYIFMYIVFS